MIHSVMTSCKQVSHCDFPIFHQRREYVERVFITDKKHTTLCCEIPVTHSFLLSLFTRQEQCDHSFKEAMKLEAVNLLSPENIHVATVTRVKGQYIWLSLEGERGGTERMCLFKWIKVKN